MVFYYYLILTHGAKPRGKIDQHPAARTQIANLNAFRASRQLEAEAKIRFDYSRKIRGLESLPRLSHALMTLQGLGNGGILMDDIARLFAVCEDGKRESFLNELLVYKDQLAGLKQGGLLAQMDTRRLEMMASGLEATRFTYGGKRPRKHMSERDRRHQTFKATLVSRKARGEAADKKARELDAIREELTRTHEKTTLKMIAEEANSRGITTTRGGTWTSSTVGRALKRIETSQSTDDAVPGSQHKDSTQDSSEGR